MTHFPVVERELLGRSRQRATYWARYGSGGIAVVFLLHFASGFAPRAAAGPSGNAAFTALSWVALLAACGSFMMTADAISSERREGTLGLLQLTGLSAREFVFGKLISAGLASIYAVIGALPALALAVLWGGVTGGQILRTGVAMLAILFVALAAGLRASVRAVTEGYAYFRAALIMAGLVLGPWLLAAFFSPGGKWARQVAVLSPFQLFVASQPAGYSVSPARFWIGLCIILLEGWILFAMSGCALRGAWNRFEQPPPIDWEQLVPFRRSRKPPIISQPLKQRGWLLDKDPICWLSLRFHDQTVLIWVGAILMVFSGSATPLVLLGGVGAGISLFTSIVPAVIFAWVAGKFFLEARRSGELELLLSTPLGGRDIVRGRWHALLIRFRGPLLFAGFLLFLEFIFAATRGGANWMRALVPINRVLDTVAVFWVAMWFGLSAKRPLAVVAWPVVLVIALPWFIGYALLGWSSLAAFLLLIKNIAFIRWAAEKLRHEFRAVAPLAVGKWFQEPEELLQT